MAKYDQAFYQSILERRRLAHQADPDFWADDAELTRLVRDTLYPQEDSNEQQLADSDGTSG